MRLEICCHILTSFGSEKLNSQSHLQGCYSLLSSYPIRSHTGLVRAAFWNHLREDITVALIERRRLMIELSDEHLPNDLEFDDDYANYVTVLLGQVINACFGSAGPLEMSKWDSLRARLETWKTWLSDSFAPIMINQKNSASFPMMRVLHGWHGAYIPIRQQIQPRR